MIRRPPRSTLFPTRRSSDLLDRVARDREVVEDLRPGLGQVRAAVRDVLLALIGDRLVVLVHELAVAGEDRKSTRLNSSHSQISYAVFCLKKKKKKENIEYYH